MWLTGADCMLLQPAPTRAMAENVRWKDAARHFVTELLPNSWTDFRLS